MKAFKKLALCDSVQDYKTDLLPISFKGQEVNLLGVGMKDNEVFITVFSDLCVLNLIVTDSNFLQVDQEDWFVRVLECPAGWLYVCKMPWEVTTRSWPLYLGLYKAESHWISTV